MSNPQVGDLVYALPSSNDNYGITKRKTFFMAVVLQADAKNITVLPVYCTATGCLAKYLASPGKYSEEPTELLEESKRMLSSIILKQPIYHSIFQRVFLPSTVFNLRSIHFKVLGSVSSATISQELFLMHKDSFARHTRTPEVLERYNATMEDIKLFCKAIQSVESTMFDSISPPHLTL